MNARATIIEPTRDLLKALATSALDEAGGDRAVGKARLIDRLKNDQVIADAVLDHLIATAAESAIASALHRRRNKAWNAPAAIVSSKDPTKRIAAFGLSNMARLLDFPLPDGTRLADATGQQVRETADAYAKQAKEMDRRGAWLAAIADRVPADRRVNDVLGEEDVRALRDGAAE